MRAIPRVRMVMEGTLDLQILIEPHQRKENKMTPLTSDDYERLPDGRLRRKGGSAASRLQNSQEKIVKAPGRNGADKSPELHTRSLSELFSRPFPDCPWLIENLLPQSGVMGIAGEQGTGKTWLILELAKAVARGQTFLDRFATHQGTVLIIDEENGERRLHRRLRQLIDDPSDNYPIHSSSMDGINLSDASWVNCLYGKMSELRPKLVIFDSLIRIHRGEENSAPEMAKLFAVLTQVRQEFGSAIVFTHHLRKRSIITDLGQRVRGSSDILAYVDSMLGLTKLDGCYKLSQLKNRDGEEIIPLLLSIEDTDAGTTEIKVVGEAEEEAGKKEQAKEIVKEALAEGDKFREDLLVLTRQTGISDRTVAQALKELETAKVAASHLDGRKKKYSTFATLQTLQECKGDDVELTAEESPDVLEV